MELSDIISLVSLIVALIAFGYSVFSNTKKYELTYQHYNDVLAWYNQVIEVLIYLKLSAKDGNVSTQDLAKLSALIESGRFYFPNVDRGDGFGKDKPIAYQGYRNVILDFLVFEYQLFARKDCDKYVDHAEALQRLFTSHVFIYLNPKKQKQNIQHNTAMVCNKDFTINEFLEKSPDAVADLFIIDNN